jgi:N-acetylmuramoyl-L-alanine amidase
VSDPEPSITWIGSPHHFNGRQGHQPIALVLHTMGGTLAGCDSWFRNPSSQVSAHYGIGLDGEIHQYVKLEDGAWANGVLESGNHWPGPAGVNPNLLTVSIETEDKGRAAQEVNLAQYAATLAVGRLVVRQCPSIRYLLSHTVISPKSRPSCCGPRWTQSGKFAQLAADLGLEAMAK